MKELRLMNKDVIDSFIRTDQGMKYLVINGECVCRAPITFDFNKYEELYALGVISGLREHLWKRGVNGELVHMDDLDDEMIQHLYIRLHTNMQNKLLKISMMKCINAICANVERE